MDKLYKEKSAAVERYLSLNRDMWLLDREIRKLQREKDLITGLMNEAEAEIKYLNNGNIFDREHKQTGT